MSKNFCSSGEENAGHDRVSEEIKTFLGQKKHPNSSLPTPNPLTMTCATYEKNLLGGRENEQEPYDTSKPYSTSTGLFVVPRTVCITGMRGRIAW